MPRYERSGTDEQIAAQLRRGVNVLAIRKDLGCGSARIHAVAKAEGLTVTRVHKPARMDEGEVTLKAQTSSRKRPNVRLTLPEGWTTVRVKFPDTDDGVITIRKASP